MTKVTKSPNMMSTTGRIPVMAAPTPIPAMPASEIGESITRAVPNSFTNPARTLNGVPASATSSPMMKTRSSRLISSASASLIACANVISRAGAALVTVRCLPSPWPSPNERGDDGEGLRRVDMLIDLARVRVGRVQGSGHAVFDLFFDFGLDSSQDPFVSQFLCLDLLCQKPQWIALVFPLFFFALGAVISAVNVAYVVTMVTIRFAGQKGRTFAAARLLHQSAHALMNQHNVLPVNGLGGNPEPLDAGFNVAGGGFAVVGVFIVLVVLAHVD